MAKARPILLWFSLLTAVGVTLMGVINTRLQLMSSAIATYLIFMGVALILINSAGLLQSDRPQVARVLGVAGFLVAAVSLFLSL